MSPDLHGAPAVGGGVAYALTRRLSGAKPAPLPRALRGERLLERLGVVVAPELMQGRSRVTCGELCSIHACTAVIGATLTPAVPTLWGQIVQAQRPLAVAQVPKSGGCVRAAQNWRRSTSLDARERSATNCAPASRS
jgi:hypothetical protein